MTFFFNKGTQRIVNFNQRKKMHFKISIYNYLALSHSVEY